MRLFTVHIQVWSAAEDGEAQFVPEGFSWPAFLFAPLWALWHRLWLLVLALLAVQIVLAMLLAAFAGDATSPIALTVALQLLIGFFANDWRRRILTRRGMVETALVAAPDRTAAEFRFFQSRFASGRGLS